MNIRELKKIIKDMPNDREIFLAGWNGKETILRYAHICCNTEYQEKINQLWISNEGFPVIK